MSSWLTFPLPNVFYYHRNRVDHGTKRNGDKIRHNKRSDFILMTIKSLEARLGGIVDQNVFGNLRLSDFGSTHTLSRKLVELVEDFYFFQVVLSLGSDAFLLYFAYCPLQGC